MALDLFKDVIKSLNEKTGHVYEEEPDAIKDYPSFIVNKAFSNTIDTLMYANEMNIRQDVSPRQNYDYYYNWIPKGKRFPKWYKKENNSKIELVKEYYNVSDRVAEMYMQVLKEEDLEYIEKKLFKGSVSKK